MSNKLSKEPMLDAYVYESNQLLEQLEQILISCEKSGTLKNDIDEIFRIMHTIKGSSAMMLFNNISEIAHSIEDLFYLLRNNYIENLDNTKLIDLILEALDFMKSEVGIAGQYIKPEAENKLLLEKIKVLFKEIKKMLPNESEKSAKEDKKNKNSEKFYILSKSTEIKTEGKFTYDVLIKFYSDSFMENIRAFQIVNTLKDTIAIIKYEPEELFDNDEAAEIIKNDGFQLVIKSDMDVQEIEELIKNQLFINEVIVKELHAPTHKEEVVQANKVDNDLLKNSQNSIKPSSISGVQNFISVSVSKLDVLMDLVGEIVITEAMVINNPDLESIELENFHKSARQLKKITNELQDVVMSIRMVPLSTTFQKMNRIVRDMSSKLQKNVQLKIIGEETEVDKNIIEQISDPLMHLIRNSIDHGIENVDMRKKNNKPECATITLEALNSGGDVYIIVKDDGAGLNKDAILKRAEDNGLIKNPTHEITDKEIYNFILLPGFSTKKNVTEFSGRGVGMDVVLKNIEKIGGSIFIDSFPGKGTSITIKIPLTLAIIDGMGIRVGNSIYTVPTVSIKESFKNNSCNYFVDPDNNEMILLRGECFKIIRLHKLFNISTDITDINDGILMIIENNNKSLCIFSDELIGEQQVVVKPLPSYVKKTKGISGCTILGDGNISLILDTSSICELN